MSRNRRDVFREVIKKGESQNSADDIAGLVMQQIAGGTEDEVAIDPALKSLLQKHAADATPMAFTTNIMARINPQPAQLVYKPLISKRAWYVAASVLGALILLSFWSSPADHAPNRFVNITIKQINALPAIYNITLMFGGLLLVLDHFITTRVNLSKQ